MDVSFIIASTTRNYDNLLYRAIDSVLAGCPIQTEVIVVSPYDMPKQIPNVVHVKEDKATGSCYAYNLGAKHAKGNYLATMTDDFTVGKEWWNIINFINTIGSSIGSFFTGQMCGIPVSYMYFVTRELYEGNLMRGYLFNPAYFHCYFDNDLAFRLHKHGITIPNFNCFGCTQHEIEETKMCSKTKYFRVDGMIFRKIWGHIPGLLSLCPLYSVQEQSDEDLEKIAMEQVDNDIYKDLY